MIEREFQKWITDVADTYGWRWWHTAMPMLPAGRGRFVPDKRGAGLPDLILMHPDPPRLIFAEVKVDAPLSDAQREFLALARTIASGARDVVAAAEPGTTDGAPFLGVYVWKPENRDLIEDTLKGKVMT